MILMSGIELATEIRSSVADRVKTEGLALTLAVILVGTDPASEKYVAIKEGACQEAGIAFRLLRFSADEPSQTVQDKIKDLNEDPTVTGIIVQLPLPALYKDANIAETIEPLKDVDGLTEENREKLQSGNDGLFPATAEGVINLLRYYQIDYTKNKVVVFGRSKLVGWPIAQMIDNEGGEVSVISSQTKNPSEISKKADIIISAVGKPKLITAEMVKKGAAVVDIGTSIVDGKLVGDVDFEEVSGKASYITPVIGGVGPMTVAMLISNILKAHDMQVRNG